jgi:hypothetical protein
MVFVALAVAATTQASTGLVGYFELGGEFEGSLEEPDSAKVGDVAVNANGTGGASPGDVYIFAGSSSSSVRQLSASDEFVRIWGGGVVKSGPDQANETQAVRVDATNGSFKLSFGADTTADIAVAATAAQVESALDALSSIGPGGVSVSGGPGGAGGATPYVVSFDGDSLAGAEQPLLKVANGSAPLAGGAATANTYTTNAGGSGREICQPADGDECKDTGAGATGSIAVDQTSGDVYVTNNDGVEKYSASGQFLRAWGKDVVRAGPDDSAINEQKRVTVKATGGTFTLGYRRQSGAPVESTPPLSYKASSGAVETALDNLVEIGGAQSSVTVTGGPGDVEGEHPYLITFHGLLGGDDLGDGPVDVLVSNPNGLEISSGSKSTEVETAVDGGGYEICKPDDACKEGSEKDSSDGLSIPTFVSSLAIAPAGAPGAGNVIVGDGRRNRVQEYSPEGAFARTFGWDVDETEPSTGFEVCTAESAHVCKEGTSGGGVGQFNGLSAVAADSSGAIYGVESERFPQVHRVQKFTPAGGLDLAPSSFGATETQALTVNAGAGRFDLIYGIESDVERFGPFPTEGTGDIIKGSTTITNVNTTEGGFEAGLPIVAIAAGRFRPHTTITAVGINSLTISKPAELTESGVILRSTRFYKTPDLPYNASASEVESALNALPSISENGGSVSVTGGSGDATGSTPYQISFDGGISARTDPAQISTSNGAIPLSGGSGPDASTASVVTTVPGGPGGASSESAPVDIAIGPGDRVFVAKKFPGIFSTCPDGLPSPSEIRVQELDPSGAVLGTSSSCAGLTSYISSENRRSSLTVNTLTGHPYLLNQNESFGHPRVNIFGAPGPSPDVALEPVSSITATGGTISGTIDPNGPGVSYPDTTGTPGATKTTYRVEFKKASDSTWTDYTPDTPIGNGTSPAPFSVGVGGLVPRTEYELRIVAVKPFTATVQEVRSFTTGAAAPEIEAFSSSNVTVDSAQLNALVNPQGTATSYHFEYGATPAYGSRTPEIDIGESHTGQTAQDQIEGLQDIVYHFRVIATNASGTAASPDQTFTFHPPACPNQTVRQQTGAAYLPDCRAYELVSPEDAGGTTLFTGGPQSPYATNPPRLAFVGQLAAIPDSGRNPINTAGDLYVATRGAEGWRTRYVGPSADEAGCAGGRPLVDGTGTPATIQNDVMADAGLNRIIDWNLGNPLECAFGYFGDIRPADQNTVALGSNAPYLWNAHGDFLDRWPTSIADVPGSEANFSCPQDPSVHPYPPGYVGNIPVYYFCSTYVDASKDLNHFVFSARSGVFGEGGLTKAPGSVYDNDTANNTLHLVSKLPGGGPIEQEPGGKAGSEELIQLPTVSADGSHVLMGTATKPACKEVDYPHGHVDEDRVLCPIITQPTHLYMRVDNAVTHDVSAGKPVHYIGATPDATKVYFTTVEQLTPDDTDQSVDLYVWSENGGNPQLTRISAGDIGSVGNADGCASTWTTNCDVQTYSESMISSASGNRGGLGSWDVSNPNPGYTDNAIAAKSGDIYFYSPEQLVEGKGVPGKENLYVYREGRVRHVATLGVDRYCLSEVTERKTCSSSAVGRLQVTPDGRFAAFVTTSNVTAYDSHGFAEMYRYDAETEKVICASCRPDGSAPAGDVMGSEGGRFLTDDGRVFFDTPEQLNPRDTNAASDVYEFVDGRPQLITSGTGTGPAISGLTSDSRPGLYGVSADGVDAYFGTTDTLVGQDRNGQQLKFYDARTNGGFPFVSPPVPCAAADECHGPSTGPALPLPRGTGAALGAGGNAHEGHRHRRRKQKHHKRHAKRTAHERKGGTR